MSVEDSNVANRISKRLRRQKLIAGILGLAAICVIGACLASRTLLQLNFFGGGYSITNVVLTDELDSDGKPVGSKDTFTPADTILGWVGTEGAEGPVGFRWYYGTELIFEHFGRTQGNQISTYIHSTDTVTLPEGDYRLEIHLTGDTPHEVVEFNIAQYRPELSEIQPTPVGHVTLEVSPYVEVPFAFDETWTINGKNWPINEVKIVFLDESPIVAVVVVAEENFSQTDESELVPLIKPVAAYAVQNGYVDLAQSLEIDGEKFEFDEIYVNLFDPVSRGGTRVPFEIEGLSEQ